MPPLLPAMLDSVKSMSRRLTALQVGDGRNALPSCQRVACASEEVLLMLSRVYTGVDDSPEVMTKDLPWAPSLCRGRRSAWVL